MAWATFRRFGGIELPDSGRSSVEPLVGSLSAYLNQFGSINPVVDFEMLKALKHLWLYNPDFSQYVANIVNLGNPGHSLSIDANSDSVAESALNRLNESSSRIYTVGCGVDGLLNQYLTSIAWSGALSSEDVVNFAARRVEKVVIVPVEQIRFRYNKETDSYDPYQQAFGILPAQRPDNAFGLIPLNQETFKYYALSTVENSPYAKPPATAAIEAILQGQVPIMDNLRHMAQKIGLLGFVDFSANRPNKKPNEIDAEYEARCTRYVASLAKALDGNLSKGLLVHLNDQKVSHEPLATSATGVAELNTVSEQQVFSGLGAQPGFHGRTDSTTETFADVVYFLLVAQVANMQRLAKRRLEATWMLDLRLGGIDVNSVTMTFNKAHNRNALQAAQTESVHQASTLERVRTGVIAPDDGAREMGYDSWFDPALLATGITFTATTRQSATPPTRTLTLSFDRAKQRYIYRPETLSLADEFGTAADTKSAGSENVVPMLSKKKQALTRVSN